MEYYTRIFQKKSNEPEEDFEKRITIIKNLMPQLPFWKNDMYTRFITVVDNFDSDNTSDLNKSSDSDESSGSDEVPVTTITTTKIKIPSRSSPDETDVR